MTYVNQIEPLPLAMNVPLKTPAGDVSGLSRIRHTDSLAYHDHEIGTLVFFGVDIFLGSPIEAPLSGD